MVHILATRGGFIHSRGLIFFPQGYIIAKETTTSGYDD